ncbi:diguanylate cyclase domain-containing protein [Candidatus Magnetaquicoccus inordinatus]|uniref:diguanylate cyclase domain-containing protein n=1 Tax=Candidatus Magnetaquicoccus inordinatus TaxID=2496818 RepID=UPI00102C64E7|nr:diguanylate cyclase [Candidatus Magnetaquicoccus inordinatus]
MRNSSLLQQATLRVLTVLFATITVISFFAIVLQHAAVDKSAKTHIQGLHQYFSQKIQQLDRQWQTEASRSARHLAGEHTHPSSLHASPQELNVDLSFLDRSLFPVALLIDQQGKILYKLMDKEIDFPGSLPVTEEDGWWHDVANQRLLRWFAQPVQLLSNQPSRLVLFVALEKNLLSLHALPNSDLVLQYHGKVISGSLPSQELQQLKMVDGHLWRQEERIDQFSLAWETDQPQRVRLLVQHHSFPLFSNSEIFFTATSALLIFSFLFWSTLGRWLAKLTRRIVQLKDISEEFITDQQLSDRMLHLLESIHKEHRNEIGALANSLRQLTHTVLTHTNNLQQHSHQLAESEERLRAMTHSLRDALLVFDDNGTIHFCSHVCASMFSCQERDLLERSITQLFSPDWLDPEWQKNWITPTTAESVPFTHEPMRGMAVRLDGQEFPIELTISQWQRQGKTFCTALVRDITNLKILEERDLRAYVNRIAISALLEIGIEPLPLHRKLEVALEIILTVPWLAMQYKGSIFLVTDDQHLEMIAQKNLHPALLQECQRIPYGYCLCGKAAQTQKMVFADALDGRHDVTFAGIREHGHYCLPIMLQERLLGVLNLYVDHLHHYDPEEEAFLTTITNTLAGVIDRGLADDRVRHMATHDALTGLPNRLLFHELLTQELKRTARTRQAMAVGFLDLDHFKAVNDTLGHDIGDLLLKAVSTRTRQILRNSDTLARMGGDEFALILPAVGDSQHAMAVCNKIVQALSEPFILNENRCQIGASIGLSLFPEHGETVELLLQTADQAMYVVKKGGRNGVTIYQGQS